MFFMKFIRQKCCPAGYGLAKNKCINASVQYETAPADPLEPATDYHTQRVSSDSPPLTTYMLFMGRESEINKSLEKGKWVSSVSGWHVLQVGK